MTRECRFWVYIMASKSRHIYTGVTNDIERRVAEHKEGRIEGFTRRYNINRLVYKERFRYVGNAIEREKEIKGWDRQKRVALIEAVNPTWEDLSLEWGTPIEMLSPAAADEKQIPRSSTPTRAKSALAGDPGCARDDNSFGANSVNERATEQQIPRELKLARDDNSQKLTIIRGPGFARDDNSCTTDSIGAEQDW